MMKIKVSIPVQRCLLALGFLMGAISAFSQKYPYNGLNSNMGNIYQLSNAQTRSISPENFTGGKGKGGMADPVRFEKDLRVTIQDLGWRHGGRYLPQQSDISSVVYWYQTEPHNKFPALPEWEYLEIN
jgi:hypothetical protein